VIAGPRKRRDGCCKINNNEGGALFLKCILSSRGKGEEGVDLIKWGGWKCVCMCVCVCVCVCEREMSVSRCACVCECKCACARCTRVCMCVCVCVCACARLRDTALIT